MRISAGTDAELVTLARTGDREAFGALVSRHAPMVRRLTRAVLRHDADADDAAQEAFFSAWSALDRFEPRQNFAPWLTRIALNAARDLRRRRKVRSTEEISPEVPHAGPGTDADADAALQRMRIDAGLGALSERQRLALLLFEVEGYGHEEIAELLGIPDGTARSDVFHAKRRMRAALGEKEGKS